ncbi:MAG: Asp-tRNA(Asn)/Glu-tRNA(Gln) amidotransferase subunit GatB [Candidatus Saccharibacteria bacterium]|nr:Asp-tRNA(Asn)/Glu-tRNA(Gln) amidotransferase subunit GatB [Candidatus Saccharibacteria bacterium]
MSEYKTTIGIECHVQLNTATKLFSATDNDAVDKEPNACVSPIDYALPGMLPVLNKAAIEKCVRAGLAMNCKINLVSRFDRKHYYYPDLPKGYQITQMYMPIIGAGTIRLPDGSEVHIEHAHLEEDAGKLTHFGTYSLVDLNRAGTPLIEIVSMPDIHSAAQARMYCEELHRLMMYAGVTNGDLYQGNMRFDINVSVSKTDELGTRTETKNLNSFRSIERAVEYEVKRQIEVLERGEKVKQETRGWNDTTGKTTSQRSKEEAQDYRYMPEPDVPPVVLEQSYVDKVAANMPMMPDEYRSKFGILNLDHSESEAILNYPVLAERLSEVCDKDIKLAPRVAHWFSGVLLAEENADKNYSLATAPELVELSEMVEKKELSSTAAKEVFLEMYDKKNTSKTPHTLAKEMNLLQENDEGAIEAIIDEVLTAPECAKAAEDVRNGEMKAIGFLVGQVMKKSKGKANPATVNELIKKKLS